MKWFDRWKKVEMDEELQILERELDSTLIQVVPRPEFISGLRKNLFKQSPEIDLVLMPQNQKLQNGILITGGVLSAFAMVFAGVRGMVSIIGIIGLLISILRQNSPEAPVPSNLAQ